MFLIGLASYMVWYIQYFSWSDRVGQNRETDEEHDEDCFEKEFKLDSVKFATDSQRGRETLGMGSCSINT